MSQLNPLSPNSKISRIKTQAEKDSKNKKDVFSYLNKLNYKVISINKFNKTDYIFSNFEFNNILI